MRIASPPLHPARLLLGLAALTTLGIAAPSHAQVIYTNFGPGDSYVSGTGWTVAGPTAAVSQQQIAGGFNTGASAYNALTFEGAFFQVAGANGVTIRLLGDLAGAPNEGVVLATSGTLPTTNPESIVTWTLNPTVTLNAGTSYWFAASAAGSDGWLAWNWNSTGANGFSFRTLVPGAWTSDGSFSPAFRVSGSVVRVGAVPEPGEWAAMGMLASGLGMLVVRKRRTQG